MSLLIHAAGGAAVGLLNGLFGAGGGIVAVTMLLKLDGNVKKAHATAILVTLVLSVVSCYFYIKRGDVNILQVIPFLPCGILGAAAGAVLLKKIPDFWLRKIFAVFILYAAVRLLL
ncbi:MAG: sulfite exporter TauE/SafE family protein [Hydrogenoanaerobacterium sp.]